MREVKEFNEFIKVRRVEEETEHWQKFLYNSELLLQIDDGYTYLDKKPSISKTMWYDDEFEAPNNCYEEFEYYNLTLNFKYDMQDWLDEIESFNKIGCCSGRVNLKPLIRSYENGYKHIEFFNNRYEDNNENCREMTEEEVAQYLEICERLKQDYIKRLKTYWKKYSNKVTTCGYWRDR
mgnify:CR=1 FL=1